MRAVVMQGFGTPDQARPGELPKPDYGPDDVLVRIHAAAANPVDWKEMAGYLASVYGEYGPSWAPGFDACGIVEAVGGNVGGLAVGDRVVVLSDRRDGQSGTFAEYARVPAKLAAKAPFTASDAQVASIPTAGLTAYQGLFRPDVGTLKAGQSVLVHGASGGIGSFAVAYAHAAGAKTAASTRAVNLDYVRSLGADLAIDYKNENVVDAVRRWAPDGVDCVLDCGTGGNQSELLDVLKPAGRFVIVATYVNDADIPVLTEQAKQRGLEVHYLILDLGSYQQDIAATARLIDEGGMKLPETTVYPLERGGEALVAVQAGGVRGKLVVTIA
jgi:NADPH:quinone reductase-like Zn-dependent oxidoreductase